MARRRKTGAMKNISFKASLSLKKPRVSVRTNAKEMTAKSVDTIARGLAQGTEQVLPKLTTALNRSMGSRKWAWPRQTERRNGRTAGTSRNIVDLGNLKNSLSLEGRSNRTKALIMITYDSPYAAMTYYGGVIANPYGNNSAVSVVIPGRPWVEAILGGTYGQPKFNLLGPFEKSIKAEWNRTFGF